MGLFSGMEKFGLEEFKDAQIIDKSQPSKADIEKLAPKPVERDETDALFDKHYTCPVCDLRFSTRSIRAGRVKLVEKDLDLRPIYDFVDPLKYDVITCDKCGYSSLTRYFGKLSTKQMKTIKESVGTNFRGLENNKPIYTYDDAIERHKLALICSIVKNAKNGEKAYTCLKLAWVIRGKRNGIDSKDPAFKELYVEEMECIKNAYEGFLLAISNEPFPIAGMDENTLKYIMSDMARKLKKYDEAAKLLGSVITSRTTNDRLKEEALKLKEIIKDELKKSSTK
ncbi:MAG: DUF2225 domain-containing protein [Lachnospiraceae bacterium]|nr:DUF2225 domain-containing protein [Lachnospiraceae bacterium]